MWTGRDLNPRPPECKVAEETAFSLKENVRLSNNNEMLESFKEFLLVDLRRSEKTAYEAVRYVRRFLEALNKDGVSREDVRQYLKQISGEATYRNTLASLKRFFRDYLEMPQIVATFRFSTNPI